MTERSKIVGITRRKSEGPAIDSQANVDVGENTADTAPVAGDQSPETGEGFFSEMEQLSDEYYEDVPTRGWTRNTLPALFLLAVAAWSGFFGWTYFEEARLGLTNDRIVQLISTWALPTLLIAVGWLLVMRNSRREADRFGDAARLLRAESESLGVRLRTVNEEITMAREFLAQNARELESLGRLSTKKLVEAAGQLSNALTESDAKAKTLETVSNAATNNLEQLRKHLPVVTSAARDVTNQIGAAGHSAQGHIETLVASLERVVETGQVARENVEAMEKRTVEITGKLADSINRSSNLLNESTDTAERRTTVIAAALENASTTSSERVMQVGEEIDRQLSESGGRFEARLTSLQVALDSLSQQSADEENRISGVIGNIATHIEDSALRINGVDAAATERAAQLAFAVNALNDSTEKLGHSLEHNQDAADMLLERSERLILALQTANQQISETVPASIEQMDNRFAGSMAQLDQIHAGASAIDVQSEEMLAKMTSIEKLINLQRNNVAQLMGESDAHFSARHEQADALATALLRTRELIEELTGDASDRVVASLLRVRETTRQAAESSKRILDEELTTVAERLSEQNKTMLSEAVDDQIATLGELIQQSISRNIELSADATQKMTSQLAEIDEMTLNLEKRLEDTRLGFDGIDHDSFAQQMVQLTESLNSTAIDVSKILSHDISDTAWAAYLKGDRGIFTRRAVKMLDAGEVRAIVGHYDADPEFREHVNRYIHDFEAMMRVLLSTRDGNAVCVTLLSSDVGKLYVALAQAIERLRR